MHTSTDGGVLPHPNESIRCPDCGSAHVATGRLDAPGEVHGPPHFRPTGLRALRLGAGHVELRDAAAVHACLTCGLLWGRLARLELRQLLIDNGTEATAAWARAVPTASRFAGGDE